MTHLTYEQQTVASPNPLARYAHLSRFKRAKALCQKYLPAKGSLLDYGAGDGRLLALLRKAQPKAQLLGLEPYMDITDKKHIFRTADKLPPKVDVITAFEVLEHLDAHNMAGYLKLVNARLAKNGHIIISVPNMLGPSLFLKYINWRFIKRSQWIYSWGDVFKAGLLLKSPPRELKPLGDYLGHTGFDWRLLRVQMLKHYKLVEEFHSPFPALWWGFNSQWFAVFERR
ncbi:MAG TPA: class I SAM-dependent methyltransferase [Alphaproteobacteria bacterium]|nr:class I SAM-dependent methyltransferase [Alphaproteobacteria bacterium]